MQVSVGRWTLVRVGAGWCRLVQDGADWCGMVQDVAGWFRIAMLRGGDLSTNACETWKQGKFKH